MYIFRGLFTVNRGLNQVFKSHMENRTDLLQVSEAVSVKLCIIFAFQVAF